MLATLASHGPELPAPGFPLTRRISPLSSDPPCWEPRDHPVCQADAKQDWTGVLVVARRLGGVAQSPATPARRGAARRRRTRSRPCGNGLRGEWVGWHVCVSPREGHDCVGAAGRAAGLLER